MSLLCWCSCKLAITRLGDYYTSLSRTMQSIFAEPVRMSSATYNQNALPTMSATTSDTSSSANDLAIHFEVSLEEIKSRGAPLNKPSPFFVCQAWVYVLYHVSYGTISTPRLRLARRHRAVIVTKLRLRRSCGMPSSTLGSHKTVGIMMNLFFP